MTVTELNPAGACALVPLTLQVHRLHVAAVPDQYVADPDPRDVAEFLSSWLQRPEVTALITGPADAPTGYLIYDVTTRAASVLKPAGSKAMLHHLCVDERHRRRGLARKLIRAMLARPDVCASDHVFTSYGAFNTASAAVMRDAGFAPETVFARHIS